MHSSQETQLLLYLQKEVQKIVLSHQELSDKDIKERCLSNLGSVIDKKYKDKPELLQKHKQVLPAYINWCIEICHFILLLVYLVRVVLGCNLVILVTIMCNFSKITLCKLYSTKIVTVFIIYLP